MQGMSSAANTAVWRVCNCAFWCTSSCREESKFTIAQAKGQCNVTVSGGCDGCGPVRTATPHIYPGCPYHIYIWGIQVEYAELCTPRYHPPSPNHRAMQSALLFAW